MKADVDGIVKLIREFKSKVGPEWFGGSEVKRIPAFDFSELLDPLRHEPESLDRPATEGAPAPAELPPLRPLEWQARLESRMKRPLAFEPFDLEELDAGMRERKFRRQDVVPLGWYVGEIVRRNLGGEWVWNEEFQTWGIKGVDEANATVFPFAKAVKLFKEREREGFSFFYRALTEVLLPRAKEKGEKPH